MGKSAPEAPDYTGAAQAQAESSRNTTNAQTSANRPNQNTPFGSTTWDQQESMDSAGFARAMQDWMASGGDPTLRPKQNDYMRQNWTQNTTLTPEAQAALDSQMQMQQGRSDIANSMMPRVQQEFGQAMDWGGFQDMQNAPDVPQYGQGLPGFNFGPGQNQYNAENIQRGIGDSQGYVQNAEDAIYGQWSNRQEPRMQQQMSQMETKLRNQGLNPGDKAYDDAMQRAAQDQNDARTMAQYQATIGSGAEGSRLQGMDLNQGNFANQASQQSLQQQLALGQQRFGEGSAVADRNNQIRGQMAGEDLSFGGQQFNQGMQAAGMNNTVRQQQIAEQMQKRGFSLNEINAIISGQQVGMPSMPGFNNAGQSQATNYMGAAQNQYSAALDATNAKNAGMANLWGGLTNLGSSAMMGF